MSGYYRWFINNFGILVTINMKINPYGKESGENPNNFSYLLNYYMFNTKKIKK